MANLSARASTPNIPPGSRALKQRGIALAIVVWFLAAMSLLVSRHAALYGRVGDGGKQ
jgi:hypothetical protein